MHVNLIKYMINDQVETLKQNEVNEQRKFFFKLNDWKGARGFYILKLKWIKLHIFVQ